MNSPITLIKWLWPAAVVCTKFHSGRPLSKQPARCMLEIFLMAVYTANAVVQ